MYEKQNSSSVGPIEASESTPTPESTPTSESASTPEQTQTPAFDPQTGTLAGSEAKLAIDPYSMMFEGEPAPAQDIDPETGLPRFSSEVKKEAEGDPQEVELDVLQENVIESLRQVYDPEVPINIYDLGLIYELNLDTRGRVDVKMTLTTPNCPVAGSLPEQVQAAVLATEGVTVVGLELVWEPQWSPDMIDEDIRIAMGFF
ncbi:MAG: iron-sulfur cluster assembly protein [Myxococcota bacterium]